MTDREMVDLIAAKLMGWKQRGGLNPWWWSGNEAITHVSNFNPLESAADSKMVRDKLAGLGWNYSLGRYGSTPCFYTFEVSRPGMQYNAQADDSEFRAVCECAVKVLTA